MKKILILRMLNARLLSKFGVRLDRYSDINQSEQFSCFDEEHIIERELQAQGNVVPYFVDIGANDGVFNSNTARLALRGWQGLGLEADPIKFATLARNYESFVDVALAKVPVSPDNIEGLLQSYGVPRNFGVLSLDIDSYDYYVLDATLNSFRPSIVITEVNAIIPPPIEFSVKYTENFRWDFVSNFQGQSIAMLNKICEKYGYGFVDLEYNNAILAPLESISIQPPSYKEVWEKGYLNRPDRRQKTFWYDDYEALLSLDPTAAQDLLAQKFADRTNFHLAIGATRDS